LFCVIGQLVFFIFFFAYVKLIGVFWISIAGKNSSAAPSFVIMACPHVTYGYAGVDKNVNVETVKRLTYVEAAYSDIKRAHGHKHTKGHTLYACLNKHFDIIGHQPCQ
jgi:hypothetical protein